jgi:hypothetical protein
MTCGQALSVTSSVLISDCWLREEIDERTNSQRILIVTVANLFADVLGVRSPVNETLRVVNIAIFMSTDGVSALETTLST